MKLHKPWRFTFVLCFFLFSQVRNITAQETLSLGFPEFSKDLNILTSPHPAAVFIRRASLARLTEATAKDSFRLLLSDSITSSPDLRVWRIRISPLAAFSDRRSLMASDVEFSLNRCLSLGMLTDIEKIETENKQEQGRSSQWVHVTLSARAVSTSRARNFPIDLSRCPILERQSSQIFGKELGNGSNYVSAGEYSISDFKAGREITLKRQVPRLVQGVTSGARVMALRSFKEPTAALAALRAGTIDAFLSEDLAVIERAGKDETLLAIQCPIYTVILRKGLTIGCLDTVVASQIRYLG